MICVALTQQECLALAPPHLKNRPLASKEVGGVRRSRHVSGPVTRAEPQAAGTWLYLYSALYSKVRMRWVEMSQ